MSTCIGPRGEYSEHTYEGETLGSEFICAWCFAFNEEAADTEVKRLRAALAAAQEREAIAWDACYEAWVKTVSGDFRPNLPNPYRAALASEGAADPDHSSSDHNPETCYGCEGK